MDYQKLIQNLLSEVGQWSRYKEWNIFIRILAFISMLPFYILAFVAIANYYVVLFLYNALLAPVCYLEAWQKENKEVHFITQAVIYLISTPFTFSLRVLLSLFSFSFYFIWFVMMLALFISSYCGIRWQPFIHTATFDKEYKWKLTPNKDITSAFVIVLFILPLLFLMLLPTYLLLLGYIIHIIIVSIVISIVFKKEEIFEEPSSEIEDC